MAHSFQIGKQAEDEAAQFLYQQGYEILERNWRYEKCEIDIIARYGQTIVFVEVKSRKGARFGHPEEFLSTEQEERIIEAAEEYLEIHEHDGESRFDIIAINNAIDGGLEHFPDAFYPSF